jgi:uncharacterized OsmC-like protein
MAATASAQTQTTGIPGRFILSAEGRHMVVDASAAAGGAAESFVAQELLAGALATCAQAIIHGKSVELGVHPSVVQVEVTSERDPDAMPPVYSSFAMDFTLSGVTQEQAEELVAQFTSMCPIYYAISSVAPMTVAVAVVD